MKEEWRELEAFPNFEVSNFGNIFNTKTRNLRTVSRNQLGLAMITLPASDGRSYTRSVALMVATAFIPRSLPHFDTPINLDGDRLNNCADNLMWRPRWFAIKYHQQFETPWFGAVNLQSHLLETDEYFETVKAPAIQYGLLAHDIVKSVVQKTHVFPTGYNFRRIDK